MRLALTPLALVCLALPAHAEATVPAIDLAEYASEALDDIGLGERLATLDWLRERGVAVPEGADDAAVRRLYWEQRLAAAADDASPTLRRIAMRRRLADAGVATTALDPLPRLEAALAEHEATLARDQQQAAAERARLDEAAAKRAEDRAREAEQRLASDAAESPRPTVPRVSTPAGGATTVGQVLDRLNPEHARRRQFADGMMSLRLLHRAQQLYKLQAGREPGPTGADGAYAPDVAALNAGMAASRHPLDWHAPRGWTSQILLPPTIDEQRREWTAFLASPGAAHVLAIDQTGAVRRLAAVPADHAALRAAFADGELLAEHVERWNPFGLDEAAIRARLPGRWGGRFETGGTAGSATSEYRDDGTWNSTTELTLGAQTTTVTASGTWTIERDHFLQLIVAESSDPATLAVGARLDLVLYAITDQELAYADESLQFRLERRLTK